MKKRSSDRITGKTIKTAYERYTSITLLCLISGILVTAAAFIYSIVEHNEVVVTWLWFDILLVAGLILVVAGVAYHFSGLKKVKFLTAMMESTPVSLETIVLSYALVNNAPEKNIKDLHFYLVSEGLADISLGKLRAMVMKAVTNVRMDMIEPALKAKLFTKDGKIRPYKFGSDFCPECGVFKNYHKECTFCGHHELSD